MNNLKGKRFNRLTVLRDSGKRQCRSIIWLCMCICGKFTEVRGSFLKNNQVKSCGCLIRDTWIKIGRNSRTHGDSLKTSRLYRTWHGMKDRCYNPNASNYKYYGAKGIEVCEEWKNDYSTFKLWAFSSGYKDNLVIDRINHTGNYEPTNCQWITALENSLKQWRDIRETARC